MTSLDLIVTGPKPAPLVRYAATELARYASTLFGHSPRITPTPELVSGTMVSLDSASPAIPDHLSEQGYVIREVENQATSFYQVCGGSPVATLWAVYDLAERWGIRYTLNADIFPDRAPDVCFPEEPLACEPDLKLRVFRTYNDFANNPCQWSAAEYGPLIDQLAKLRLNGILMTVRPSDPVARLVFRGVAKSLAAVSYGWRFPIKANHPGYELFEQSGDAERGEFTNPDFWLCSGVDEAHKRGAEYFRKICSKAHARGMRCILSLTFTDYDPVIKKRLLELTKPEHKSPPKYGGPGQTGGLAGRTRHRSGAMHEHQQPHLQRVDVGGDSSLHRCHSGCRYLCFGDHRVRRAGGGLRACLGRTRPEVQFLSGRRLG